MKRLATRTARLHQMEELLLLSPEGVRIHEMAEKLGVNRRTIYRDVDFLCDQGVPIWQKDGRFGINRATYKATIQFSFHEAIALVLAGLLLTRTIDERNPHVTSALRKLAKTLPSPFMDHLKRAADRVQTRSDGHRQVAVMEALAEGWGTAHKVEIGYRSPRSGILRTRTLSPYALEPTPSGIYVIGFDEWAKDTRTFKLDRLETAVVLEDTFTVPASFDLESHLSSGWRIMAGDEVETVRLQFSAAVTAHIHERHWHPTQTLEKTDDGGCLLTVKVAQPQEMQPFIRSWGAQVKVLSPVWLQAEIAQDLREAADQYGR